MIKIAKFNNLNFDKLGLDKLVQDKKKLIAVIAVAAIVLFVDLAFLMELQVKSLKEYAVKAAKLSKDLTTFKKDSLRLKSLKPADGEKNKKIAKVKELISQEESSALLGLISDLANKNNLKLSQINPVAQFKSAKPADSGKPAAKTAKKAPVKTDSASSFSSLLITLDLSGDYHNLGKFINDLENANKFMAVEEIKITLGSKDDYLRQNISLVVRAYAKK